MINSELALVTLVAVATAANTASWLMGPAFYGLGREAIRAI